MKNIIYSLGGACWVYSDIPIDFRADSFFKGAGAIDCSVFTPKIVFNKKMFMEDFLNYKNWQVNIQSPDWIQNHVFDLQYLNTKLNIKFAHVNVRKTELSNIVELNKHLDWFEKNKHNLFFVIDFQRGGYELFTNEQVLDFEHAVLNQGIDLRNFVYLDVSDAKIKDRFIGSRINVFVQDVNDKLGFDHPDNPNEFRNTRCFFARHMDYVNEQLDRLNDGKHEIVE